MQVLKLRHLKRGAVFNGKTRCALFALFTFRTERDTERFMTSNPRQQHFGWEALCKVIGVNVTRIFPRLFLKKKIYSVGPINPTERPE